MQQERPSHIRPYSYIAAGMVITIGVLVALLLPRSVPRGSVYYGPGLPPTSSGVGVWPRVGIALAGLAGAALLLMLARPSGGRAPKDPSL